MGFLQNIQSAARKQGAPITVGIAVALVVSSLFFWLFRFKGVDSVALTGDWMHAPWVLLTYPFAFTWLTDPLQIVFFIFLIIWLLQLGGSVERDLGPVRYGVFFAAMTVIPSLAVWLGWLVCHGVGQGLALTGPLLPLAGITVAWGMRNQTTQISLWGIPINGKILAILDTGICLFTIGSMTGIPILGAFACIHLALAWAFAVGAIPGLNYAKPMTRHTTTRGEKVRDDRYFDDVHRREKEREERERLRKLFEGSLSDDQEA